MLHAGRKFGQTRSFLRLGSPKHSALPNLSLSPLITLSSPQSDKQPPLNALQIENVTKIYPTLRRADETASAHAAFAAAHPDRQEH